MLVSNKNVIIQNYNLEEHVDIGLFDNVEDIDDNANKIFQAICWYTTEMQQSARTWVFESTGNLHKNTYICISNEEVQKRFQRVFK